MLCSLPLVVRRELPLVALVAVALVQTVWVYGLYPLRQQPPLVPFVQLLVVVYSAGAYCGRRTTVAAGVVVAVGVTTSIPRSPGSAGRRRGGTERAIVLAFVLGLGFARIRRHAAQQEQRVAVAERERADAVERAANDERARIARELHDVISHDVSLMVLQASIERRARDSADPAWQTFDTIETTGARRLPSSDACSASCVATATGRRCSRSPA